jgi:hypothetical protein
LFQIELIWLLPKFFLTSQQYLNKMSYLTLHGGLISTILDHIIMKINISNTCEICKGLLSTRFVKLETFEGNNLQVNGEMQIEQNDPIYIHVYCLSDFETQIRNLNEKILK